MHFYRAREFDCRNESALEIIERLLVFAFPFRKNFRFTHLGFLLRAYLAVPVFHEFVRRLFPFRVVWDLHSHPILDPEYLL